VWRKAWYTTPEQAAAAAEKHAAAERERAVIGRALGPQPVVITIPAKDAQPIASAAPILESAAAAGAASPRDKGGSPGIYDWPELIAKLEERIARGQFTPFENKDVLKEWMRHDVRLKDGTRPENPPGSRTRERAIKKYNFTRFL
jgi:hypothetical protein